MEAVQQVLHNARIQKWAALVGGVAAVALAAKKIYSWKKQFALCAERAAMKQDVVYLCMFPPWEYAPSICPSCYKVLAFMRLAQIPYETVYTMIPRSSPTGRLPYIVLNGEVTCESAFIIERLKKHFKVDPDSWLSPEQHATGLAARRLLEDNMNWCEKRFVMVDNGEAAFRTLSKDIAAPKILVRIMFRKLRKHIIEVLNTQGTGDLTNEQYHAMWLQDIVAFETLLGTKKFLLGDKPTSYDCAALASLFSNLKIQEITCPALEHLRSSPRLCCVRGPHVRAAVPRCGRAN